MTHDSGATDKCHWCGADDLFGWVRYKDGLDAMICHECADREDGGKRSTWTRIKERIRARY
jgi:hypothetical protein